MKPYCYLETIRGGLLCELQGDSVGRAAVFKRDDLERFSVFPTFDVHCAYVDFYYYYYCKVLL